MTIKPHSPHEQAVLRDVAKRILDSLDEGRAGQTGYAFDWRGLHALAYARPRAYADPLLVVRASGEAVVDPFIPALYPDAACRYLDSEPTAFEIVLRLAQTLGDLAR